MPSSNSEKWLQVEISESDLAGKFDHTNLQPEATLANIELLCTEAKNHNFFAVCINPCHVRFARDLLAGTPVRVCTVIGFPLGANCGSTKLYETEVALGDRADEIDVVMNIGFLKSGRLGEVTQEIGEVVRKVKSGDPEKIAKVIIESALLTPREIELACKVAGDTGADFIKTSTGFSRAGGATLEALKIINLHRGKLKVKAAGGIKDLKTALLMLGAGADRLGASSSVSILRELRERTRQGTGCS